LDAAGGAAEMSALPQAVVPMLGKLVPRLASNHPGEVAATAAAITRVLATNKLDWHDLTAALLRPQQPARPATEQPRRAAEQDWRELLAYCIRYAHRLRERECDFLDSLERWDGEPTEKQLAWLKAIARKLRGDI
jgi:hypothetical protein